MAATLEEKIEKARETALAKAEKDGLDEVATTEAVEKAVEKVVEADKKAQEKAAKEAEAQAEKEAVFIVESPVANYCGVGAAGVHFANGKAEVKQGWVLDWYKNKGYKVTKKA